jgi:hypothetical protein
VKGTIRRAASADSVYPISGWAGGFLSPEQPVEIQLLEAERGTEGRV